MQDLAERGRKGCETILKLLWSIGEHSPGFFFRLFDSQIVPILTYGAEIWGISPNQEVIERVHLAAMKRFLGVNQRAPRHLIYGELGRYPLSVTTNVKCIKFWLRVVNMDNVRYPKKAYKMLMELQRQNYTTWACAVRNTLYKFGFGIVWETQGVGNVKSFIALFKQRLVDCFTQDWHRGLQSHAIFDVYGSYCPNPSLKPYLTIVKCINIRHVFSRFRLGMSRLRGHYLQYNVKPGALLLRDNCPFCSDTKETELHFLLSCLKYDHLRNQYIPLKFCRNVTLFKMSLLLACPNEKVIICLCNYIFKALKLREIEMCKYP